VVLDLDDVSEIHNADVHEQIARLFRHGCRCGSCSSAGATPLPLHRLRVSGDLCPC